MFKRFALAVGTSYINLFLNAVTVLIVTRMLLQKNGSDDVGLFALFSSLSTIIILGIGWLSSLSVVRFGKILSRKASPEGITGSYRLIFWGFILYGVAVAVLLLLVAFIGPYPAASRNSFIWLALYAVVICLNAADMGLMSASLRQATVNLYRILSTLIYGIGSIALLYFAPRVDFIFLSLAAGAFVITILVQLHVRVVGLVKGNYLCPPKFHVLRKLFRKTALHNFFLSALGAWFTYSDLWLLGLFLGSKAAAYYFMGTKIADIIVLLIGRVIENTAPYYSRLINGKASVAREFFCWINNHLIVITCMAISFYWIFGDDIVKLWLGVSDNIPADSFLWLAGAGILFQSFFRHHFIVLFTAGRQQSLIKIMLVEALCRAAFIVVSVKFLGFYAPVVSFLVTQMLYFFWKYFSMAKQAMQENQLIILMLRKGFLVFCFILLSWLVFIMLLPAKTSSLLKLVIAAALYAIIGISVFIWDNRRHSMNFFQIQEVDHEPKS